MDFLQASAEADAAFWADEKRVARFREFIGSAEVKASEILKGAKPGEIESRAGQLAQQDYERWQASL